MTAYRNYQMFRYAEGIPRVISKDDSKKRWSLFYEISDGMYIISRTYDSVHDYLISTVFPHEDYRY